MVAHDLRHINLPGAAEEEEEEVEANVLKVKAAAADIYNISILRLCATLPDANINTETFSSFNPSH